MAISRHEMLEKKIAEENDASRMLNIASAPSAQRYIEPTRPFYIDSLWWEMMRGD